MKRYPQFLIVATVGMVACSAGDTFQIRARPLFSDYPGIPRMDIGRLFIGSFCFSPLCESSNGCISVTLLGQYEPCSWVLPRDSAGTLGDALLRIKPWLIRAERDIESVPLFIAMRNRSSSFHATWSDIFNDPQRFNINLSDIQDMMIGKTVEPMPIRSDRGLYLYDERNVFNGFYHIENGLSLRELSERVRGFGAKFHKILVVGRAIEETENGIACVYSVKVYDAGALPNLEVPLYSLVVFLDEDIPKEEKFLIAGEVLDGGWREVTPMPYSNIRPGWEMARLSPVTHYAEGLSIDITTHCIWWGLLEDESGKPRVPRYVVAGGAENLKYMEFEIVFFPPRTENCLVAMASGLTCDQIGPQ